MSISWMSDADPAPAILVLPPDAASLDEAHDAIELWEHYTRKHLDGTQRLAVEVMMAQTDDGRWAAATTGREMPRQQGKGDEIEVPELWGLVQRGEAIMHTVHDAALLATQAQQRMLGVIESHADLRRKMKRRHVGIGQQMIEMRNGGTIWYRTRTGGGGRGVDDIDRLVVDEAQHAAEEHLAALSPTLFANPNPQMNVLGTAGIEGRSDWWWRVRLRALRGDPGAFGYVGHTAERVSVDEDGKVVQEPVDVSDRALWLAANPALAQGRGQGMEFFEEQYRRLTPTSFAQEHLGVWCPPPVDETHSIIPAARWKAGEDARSGPVGDVEFALDLSPMRDTFAINVAAESGVGGSHVEVVHHGPLVTTDFLVGEAKRLQDRHGGSLTIVAGSPAASLEESLRAAGVRLNVLTAAEYVQACGELFDAVMGGRLHHLGQPEMSAAIAGADRKWSGDAWYWARRISSVDITPLVSATTALFAHLHARKPALSVW